MRVCVSVCVCLTQVDGAALVVLGGEERGRHVRHLSYTHRYTQVRVTYAGEQPTLRHLVYQTYGKATLSGVCVCVIPWLPTYLAREESPREDDGDVACKWR